MSAPSEPRLLERASALVNGGRAADYGSATKNWERIAALWSEVLGTQVTVEQAILCMVQVKVARLCHSPHHEDSWTDIAGYAAVWEKTTRGE